VSASQHEVARRFCDAFNDADWEAFADCLTDDVVYDVRLGFVTEVTEGRDAVVESIRQNRKEMWSEIRFDLLELQDEPGCLLARLNVRATGKSMGIDVSGERWEAYRFSGARISHYVYRLKRADALAAIS
jgi:ketosteroid isomerase-like protein